MKHRVLAVTGALIGVCALISTLSVQTNAQSGNAARSSTAGTTTVLKTPWGHPDLQGVWTTDEEIGVPLERPVELGTKAVLTEEEYRTARRDVEEEISGQQGRSHAAKSAMSRRPVHWYEGGKKISYRTSLVIDPPERANSAATRPEAEKRVVKKGNRTGLHRRELRERARSTVPRTWPSPIGASPAACRRPGFRASTTTASRSCSRPTTSRSATSGCTRRA